MIVATKSVDALLKGVISQDKLMISRIDSIIESVVLDPNLTTPKKELYVVSNDDVRNPKVRKEFEIAVKGKHPNSLIMYINKNGRPVQGIEEDMFDAYLAKPKRDEVKDKFFELVEEAEAKAKFKVNDEIQELEEFKIEEVVKPKEQETQAQEEASVTLEFEEEVIIEEKEDELMLGNTLLERIKQAENWAAINSIAHEVSASKVLQEISEANASFRQSENYVTALAENITAILSNPEYDTATQLSKVRAIQHDRAYVKAKNNTIIEQSVEQIITALVDKSKEEVESKTQQLDEKIIYAFKQKETGGAPNVRLATIIEQRTKTLLELHALDLEIKGLATTCLNTVNETVEGILTDSTVTTESPLLDSQMKARYGEIAPANIVMVLDELFKLGETTSEEFGKMSESVHSTVRKLYQLLSYYQEEVEVLAKTIKYLKANSVEDTVIANTILKKTSRLYVHNGDFDSTALTYIIAKHHSRRNNNVLLLDLTNSGTLELFGVEHAKYSEFMEVDKFDNKMLVVSNYKDPGVSLTTEEDCQRLSTRLLHYAKHFSMVNIMCTPEQESILQHFMGEVMSITYLVDCYKPTISRMARCIDETKVDNTANRIVLVNYIADSSTICKELNVMDRLEVQLNTCKTIPEIRSCSLHNQNPYEVDSILEDCMEILKVC